MATFSISATLLELVLTSAVFAKIGVPAISLCVVGGAALYTWYTVALTTMRVGQRREVNGASKRAQDVVVDSLLNFETVKLFAAEATEARRYGGFTTALSELQVKAQDSLSLLNWGQTGAMQLGSPRPLASPSRLGALPQTRARPVQACSAGCSSRAARRPAAG